MNPRAKVEEVWEYLRETEDKLEGVVSKYNELVKTTARLERKDAVREILLGEMKRDAYFKEAEVERMKTVIASLESLLDYERANSFRKTKALKGKPWNGAVLPAPVASSSTPKDNNNNNNNGDAGNNAKMKTELKRLGSELEAEVKRSAELTSALDEWIASHKSLEEELASVKSKSLAPLPNKNNSSTSTQPPPPPPQASLVGDGALAIGEEKPPKNVSSSPSPAPLPSPQLQEIVAKVEGFVRGAVSLLSKL